MPLNWKTIIDDKAKYADTAEVTIAGEKYTLAELRSANAESNGAVLRQLESQRSQLTKDQTELGQAQENFMRIFQQFSEATGASLEDIMSGKVKMTKAEAAKSAAAGTGLDENDPILAPVIKHMTEMKGASDSQITKLEMEVKNTQKALAQALKANLDDHYEREFSTLSTDTPAALKGKLTYESVIKHAEENRLLDKHGRYNVKKAFGELTADARIEERLAKAKEEGIKVGKEEATLSSIQRPGANRQSHIIQPDHKNADGTTKSIEQAINDAFNDKDILTSLSAGAGAA